VPVRAALSFSFMETTSQQNVTVNRTNSNIEAIAKFEHASLGERTISERVSDFITKLVGNLIFLTAQLIVVLGWLLLNLHIVPGIKPFDPFPFGVLALIVSSEGVFLTIFVLVRQSRMTRQSERRSHLDLQVSMLSEQELTTIVRMLQKLCQHLDVDVEASEKDVQSFSETTEIHKLASDLKEKIPEE
jgi:uncharacterized membrane protein